MSRLINLRAGDVCAVRGPQKWYSLLIRLGAWLRGQPSTVSHVVVITAARTLIDGTLVVTGMEARPSKVGPVDMRMYDNQWLLHNASQPKTDQQRIAIVNAAHAAAGTRYDWWAIGADALACLGVDQPSIRNWGQKPPSRLVCSAFASWCYAVAGVAEPSGEDRWCTPGDWAAWCQGKQWETVGVRR